MSDEQALIKEQTKRVIRRFGKSSRHVVPAVWAHRLGPQGTVRQEGIVVDAIAVSSHDDAISPVVGYGIVVYARIGGTETALG